MHRDEAARSQAAEMHPVGVFDDLGDRVLPVRGRRYRGRTAIRKTCTAAARAVDTPQAPWGILLRGGGAAHLHRWSILHDTMLRSGAPRRSWQIVISRRVSIVKRVIVIGHVDPLPIAIIFLRFYAERGN